MHAQWETPAPHKFVILPTLEAIPVLTLHVKVVPSAG